MAFPPAFLERLRGAVMLSELIGRRVPLRRQGREWAACCPFHQEKSPSFTVNNEKGFFHCFGCGAHGDAVEFLKRYEHLTYPEAVEKLARECGIALPEQTPAQQQREQAQRSLYSVMEEACRFFETELKNERGLAARQYLEKRGITPETITRFRLGYAPDARDALKRALLAKGVKEAEMVEAGLLIRPDQGATYDRFRGRIIFPIRDSKDRVIAFGGRVLASPAATPGGAARPVAKYLNSPETPLFRKGETIYNLNLAGKSACARAEIILVEGYMDVVSVAQAGFAPVVATLGTAVTPEQLKRLWHYANAPTLCLDGDAAGLRASLRAAEVALPLLTPGKSLKFATLPKGEDPDSLIRAYGLPRFEEALGRAREIHDVLWLAVSAQHSGDAPATRAALEKTLMDKANAIADPTTRSHFRQYFRERIRASSTAAHSYAPRTKEMRRTPSAPAEMSLPTPRAFSAQERMLGQMLAVLRLHPGLCEEAQTEEMLLRVECENPVLGALRAALLEGLHSGHNMKHVMEYFEKEEFYYNAYGILKDESLLLPREVHKDPLAARAWLEQLQASYHLALLEEERRHAEQALLQANEQQYEALLERLKGLQQEIRSRTSERARVYALHTGE